MGSDRGKSQRKVAGILPDILSHHGWHKKLEMHSFFPQWEKIVGETVAECSKPKKIVKDVLWVEVSNSAWMQQLQFEKFQILEDINATLRHSRIRDIKFTLPQEKDEKQKIGIPPLLFSTPDPDKLSRFEKQAEVIQDDAARKALIRLWYLSQACRREKKE